MRVLMTGHLGYIGAVMAPFFTAAGHEVIGLDTGYFAAQCLGPAPEPIAELRMDLRDVTAEHLSGIDCVVHLAALSNDPLGSLEPQQTYDINHHASISLAEAAKAAGVERYIYSSSCSVYGKAGQSGPLDETAEFAPVTPYAISKVRVEDELNQLADDNFTTVSMRNATAYGFSPLLRTDIVLNDLTAWALLTGEVKVLSDGTPWRPIVHIEDISRAFLAAAEAPRDAVHMQAFNVGRDSENYQVADIAAIVGEVVPDARVTITGEAGNDPRSYQVDFAKIHRVLPAYDPQWTARGGAEELADAYRRHGLTMDRFQNAFKRLPILRDHMEAGRLDTALRWT